MSAEKLIRVSHADALRAGDLLVLKACLMCGANHRFMALSRNPSRSCVFGCQGDSIPWLVVPDRHRLGDSDCGVCLKHAAAEGRLFRVDTGVKRVSRARKKEMQL